MGWRFRKRIKVAPGTYVNLSKSGASTTFKPAKGISISTGKDGTYLNTGIPGSGIYNRQKISSAKMNSKKDHFTTKNTPKTKGKLCLWLKLFLIYILLIILFALFFSYNKIIGALIGIGGWALVIYGMIMLFKWIGKHKTDSSRSVPMEPNPEGYRNKNANEDPRTLDNAKKDGDSNNEITIVRKTVTKEMVDKLLAPFSPIVVPIPPDADPLYLPAWKLVVSQKKATIVMLQRQFQISNVRAGRIINQLEKEGRIGPANGSQPRRVNQTYYRPWEHENPSREQLIVAGRIVTSSESTILHSIGDEFYKSMPIGKRILSLDTERRIHDRLVEAGFVKHHRGSLEYDILVTGVEVFEQLVKESSMSPSILSDGEVLSVADELFTLCQQLSSDEKFIEEVNRHNINIKESDGKPMFGEDGKVRSLFFLDVAHCYSEMAERINLKENDGIGVLYLIFRLFKPEVDIKHNSQHIKIIQESLPSSAESLISQIQGKPFFRDGDIDFTTAAILKRYDKDLFNKYLTLLYRFCSLVAKADGKVTEKEQAFIDHIAQLRLNSVSNNNGVRMPQDNRVTNHLQELDNLIGLESVKQEVHTMSNFIRVQLSRQKQGLKTSPMSYHCVFTGNPGTGKTTIARIIAGIYAELGVLKKGHLVETDRSGLVAEFVGQTAVKTNKVIDSAIDGVLFIDEAYSLVGGQNDFGKEAIATLLKRMEDERDQLVVILAGYGAEMQQFIDSNPGLQSRFNRYIQFPDYTAEELHQIFCSLVTKYDYELTEETSTAVLSLMRETVSHKDKNFGNGRTVRNMFEKTLERQANRLSKINTPSLVQLKEITIDDILVSSI